MHETNHHQDALGNAPEELLLDLARRHFAVGTLETRNRDSLDFHQVAVWSIRAALEEAYRAGLAAR